MLVLTRKLNQEIVIGDDVTVRIVGIVGGQIRLGITAPPLVRVDRREVRDAIDREGFHAEPARAEATA